MTVHPAAHHALIRWGVPLDTDERTAGQLMAISLGLDALFGGNKEAERAWMWRDHPELGMSPLVAVCAGRIEAVINTLDRERNLR